MKKILNYTKNVTNKIILENSLVYSALSNLLTQRSSNLRPLVDYNTIYIDVSIFAKHDNMTGIQRVIRELIFQFLKHPEFKLKIQFVIATKKTAYKCIHYKLKNHQIDFDISNIKQTYICPKQDDVFFGLDFCPNIVPYHLADFIQWKLKGVKFIWLLHDLLPLTQPNWFTYNNTKNFLNWFKTVLLTSNHLLCVSHTVRNQVIAYAGSHQYPCPICTVIPLGYRFNTVKEDNSPASNVIFLGSYVLMVGTLEPRKGHKEIITMFTHYWRKNITHLNLVLVGKQGWRIDELITMIEQNKFYNKKLFWLKDVDDKQLIALYHQAKGTIMASLDEGFGLPLIESIAMNKHILVRDIPVFREVGMKKHNLTYFNSKDLFELGKAWLNKTINSPIQKNNYLDDTDFGWQKTFATIATLRL